MVVQHEPLGGIAGVMAGAVKRGILSPQPRADNAQFCRSRHDAWAFTKWFVLHARAVITVERTAVLCSSTGC